MTWSPLTGLTVVSRSPWNTIVGTGRRERLSEALAGGPPRRMAAVTVQCAIEPERRWADVEYLAHPSRPQKRRGNGPEMGYHCAPDANVSSPARRLGRS